MNVALTLPNGETERVRVADFGSTRSWGSGVVKFYRYGESSPILRPSVPDDSDDL